MSFYWVIKTFTDAIWYKNCQMRRSPDDKFKNLRNSQHTLKNREKIKFAMYYSSIYFLGIDDMHDFYNFENSVNLK